LHMQGKQTGNASSHPKYHTECSAALNTSPIVPRLHQANVSPYAVVPVPDDGSAEKGVSGIRAGRRSEGKGTGECPGSKIWKSVRLRREGGLDTAAAISQLPPSAGVYIPTQS